MKKTVAMAFVAKEVNHVDPELLELQTREKELEKDKAELERKILDEMLSVTCDQKWLMDDARELYRKTAAELILVRLQIADYHDMKSLMQEYSVVLDQYRMMQVNQMHAKLKNEVYAVATLEFDKAKLSVRMEELEIRLNDIALRRRDKV